MFFPSTKCSILSLLTIVQLIIYFIDCTDSAPIEDEIKLLELKVRETEKIPYILYLCIFNSFVLMCALIRFFRCQKVEKENFKAERNWCEYKENDV